MERRNSGRLAAAAEESGLISPLSALDDEIVVRVYLTSTTARARHIKKKESRLDSNEFPYVIILEKNRKDYVEVTFSSEEVLEEMTGRQIAAAIQKQLHQQAAEGTTAAQGFDDAEVSAVFSRCSGRRQYQHQHLSKSEKLDDQDEYGVDVITFAVDLHAKGTAAAMLASQQPSPKASAPKRRRRPPPRGSRTSACGPSARSSALGRP